MIVWNAAATSARVLCALSLCVFTLGPQAPSVPDGVALHTLIEEGEGAQRKGDFATALAKWTQAVPLAERLSDDGALAVSLVGLGWAQWGSGQYDRAKATRERALALYQTLGDASGESIAQQAIGETLFSMGQYAEAVVHYERALDANRRSPSAAREASILSNVGSAYRSMGRFGAALDALQKSLATFRSLGDQSGSAQTLNFLGIVSRAQAEYDRAIAYYRESIAIRRASGDRRGQAQALGNLGGVYLDLGQVELAIEASTSSLLIAQEIGYTAQVGFAEQNIGSALAGGGRPLDALARYQIALDIWRRIGRTSQVAWTLHKIGILRLFQLNEIGAARDSLTEGLAVARTIRDPEAEGYSLYELGNVERLQGAAPAALTRFDEALRIAQSIGSRDLEYQVLADRGRALTALGRVDEAIADLRESVRIVNDLRVNVRSDMSKIAFVDTRQDVFQTLATTLLAAGRPGEALEAAEAGRARAFADLLSSRRVQAQPQVRPALSKLRAAVALREESGADSSTSGDATARGADLAVDAALAGVRAQNPELASLVAVESPSVAAIADTARRLRATIVEYLVTDDALIAWVVDRSGSIHSSRTDVSAARLARLIRDLHEQLDGLPDGRTPASLTPQLQELGHIVIEPIAAWLPTSALDLVVVIPHGPLALLPFAALADASGRPLIERHTLAFAPAASLFQYTSNKRAAKGSVPITALIVVDPVPPDGSGLSRLAGSGEEGRRVAARLGSSRTRVLTGGQASEAAVKRAGGSARILHFATHGLVSEVRPGDSSLLLASGEGEDGYLRVDEIFGLDLHADLVVLSGCSTGLGKPTGDGIFGLSRAFLYAGTPSVIVSLWDVSDHATAYLMDRFYAELTNGLDKAHALREAQRATRIRFHQPAVWAPFILIGESR